MSRIEGEADPSEVAAAWLEAMRAGDWEAAWRQTDRIELPRRARQAQPGFAAQAHHLTWDGTPWLDRSVRVRCLHGLGDTLQFMRFVPQLQAQARELHFLVQPVLLELLQGVPGLGKVSTAWTDDPPPADVELEVMELAYAVRATEQDVAPPVPGLATQLASRRRPPGLPKRRPRVALFWSGSDYDTSRSPPPETLAPLLDITEVQFCSFQQGPAAAHPALAHGPIVTLSEHTQEIADLAAALLEMDLVISVDGMPAHLAATLGRPTWILLKHDPDWRWMRGRSDSPWYPSARLFRQPTPGDWPSVAAAVGQALRDQLASGWLMRST